MGTQRGPSGIALPVAAGKARLTEGRVRWGRFILAGLVLYIGTIMIVQQISLNQIRRERREVAARLVAAHDKNRALWEQVQIMRTDAYIEKMAREELGLARPGEILYLPGGGGQ